jgi:capsular exopolysaccharide synthesis family protein
MSGREIQKRDKMEIAKPTEGQMVWIPPGYELTTEAQFQDQGPHLWDYIWLVWRRRWLVFLVFLIVVGITAVITLRAEPIYEAVAKIQIEQEMPTVFRVDRGADMAVATDLTDFMGTQIRILSGRLLARDVVLQLNLFASDDSPTSETGQSPVAAFISYLKSFVPRGGEPRALLSPAEQEESDLRNRVSAFISSLTVERDRETQIVEVKFLSPDPELGAKVANALCEAYKKWNYQSKIVTYDLASSWLRDQLRSKEDELNKSRNELSAFMQKFNIVPGQENADNVTKSLDDMNQKMIQAQLEYNQKEVLLKQIEGSDPINFAEIVETAQPTIKKMVEDLSDLKAKMSEMGASIGPNMPEMKGLKAQIASLESSIAVERRKILDKARMNRDRARKNYESIAASYKKLREGVLGDQDALARLRILQNKVESNTKSYNDLLDHKERVGVQESLKASNVKLIEPAEQPASPMFPKKKRNMMLGACLGLFLGIGMAFFLDYMDTTVKDAEEVEKMTQLGTLGYIPHYEDKASRGVPPVPIELITAEKPRSLVAENIRYLRTSVLYSLAGRSPKSIIVTSAFGGEGKTTVSINLAIAFAQRGQKVLLIDADLKRPAVHRFFAVDRSMGLTEILTGKVDEALGGIGRDPFRKTDIENLYVLPAGSKPPNPVDLLDSDVMRDLLALLAEEYDHIILDSPPLMGMADTSVLVPYVDGVILVVRPGKTPRQAVRRCKEKVTGLQGRILGVVMNNPRQGPGGGYSYGYGAYEYGYGYGYDSGNGAEGQDEEEEADKMAGVSARGAVLPAPGRRDGGDDRDDDRA